MEPAGANRTSAQEESFIAQRIERDLEAGRESNPANREFAYVKSEVTHLHLAPSHTESINI